MTGKQQRKTAPDEYDFSGAEKGRYYSKYREGANVVVLDPDVAAVFSSSESVNTALRAIASSLREAPTDREFRERVISALRGGARKKMNAAEDSLRVREDE